MSKSLKKGSCHCGAVTWEAMTADDVVIEECNCSMCAAVGFLHLIVPAKDFTLLTGQDALTEYTFNAGVAKHLFCRHCGVKSFYIPRSNPDGYSLNLRCMDRAQFNSIKINQFDGQNWEANADRLKELSKS
jgi:hypothetical protein